jgi:hypothetical protein
MRLQRRGAVRAHDAQVLDPVVVTDAVDVIQDQGHSASAPHLALAAELALTHLQPRLVEPLLQMATRERRAGDEDLFKRSFRHARARERVATRGVRIEVIHRDPPDLGCVPLERSPVVAARAHPETPQRLRVRA